MSCDNVVIHTCLFSNTCLLLLTSDFIHFVSGIPRKRNSTNTPSFSDESFPQLGSTPTLPKKRRISTTPQYDIDNIIIPYSMAASTRLEKLEYKEIVTPKWRKIMKGSVSLSNGPILNGDTLKDVEREDSKKIVRKIDKKMENREHTLNREEVC